MGATSLNLTPRSIYKIAGLLTALVSVAVPVFTQGSSSAKARPSVADYVVRVVDIGTPRLHVTAKIPLDGSSIQMDQTRPADIPQVGDDGWPALIRNLRVADASGRTLDAARSGSRGWQLEKPFKGIVTLTYEVDYSVPAANNWPAPREAAFRDEMHFVFVGRSAFITTPEVGRVRVKFVLPSNWSAVVPWARIAGAFSVGNRNDLTENLIVLTRDASVRVSVAGFRVAITAMGHCRPMRAEIANVIRRVIPQFVRMFPTAGSENYSVVLLPIDDSGAESYRGSFAYNLPEAPSIKNRSVWSTTIAHEIFHYWNGWRLRGTDYASTQWFQEGFTVYAADIAMTASGLSTREDLRRRLSEHLANYRRLSTPLAAPGNRKGPPLYSGGALVAFCWDVLIRSKTSGKRGLPSVFNALWRHTNGGSKTYEWNDIRAVLGSTAHYEWEDFYQRYIRSQERLPLESVLSRVGLNIIRQADGSESVETDPNANADAKALWTAVARGE